MPGDPVRQSEFEKTDGELDQAMREYLPWVANTEFPDAGKGSPVRLDNIRLTSTLLGAHTVEALAVLRYWMRRNNLRAATFWLQMVMSQLPAAYEEKVRQMDRHQVEAEIEAWGAKLGYTPAQAHAVAKRLVEGSPSTPPAREE
jgi:hypothetical protein